MAKKSKAFSELLRLQQGDRIEQREMQRLAKKMRKNPHANNVAGIVANPKGQVKMSAVLEQFAEPYVEPLQEFSEVKGMYRLAIVAWNAALLPESDRPSLLDPVMEIATKGMNHKAKQELKTMVDDMMARKLELFDENKRHIIDFQIKDYGTEYYITVAATLPKSFQPSSEDQPVSI
ncbi:MAG: hypothetical protein MUF49_12665 [Oculatellaceae cyanobacterium Prado106]|jgi:hypothetical protein|nr:hypothetical protein [Oculatellaceae cyanobacterium Prado106]